MEIHPVLSLLEHVNYMREDMLAERRLKESNERYRALFEGSGECIYLHDFEGKFIDANASVLNLLGYSRAEIQQLTLHSLLTPDQLAQAQRAMEEIRKTGSQSVNSKYRLTTKNGECRIVETRGSLVYRDGVPWAIQGIARDITEQKRMEEKLSALHAHTLQLGKATHLDQVVESSLNAMEFALGFSYATFSTNEGGYNRVLGYRGKKPSVTELPLNGPGVVVKATRSKSSVIVPDNRKEPAYVNPRTSAGLEPAMLSTLAVPVIMKGEAVAVLNVENTRINAFSVEDQVLLEILANHVAAALDRINQERELRLHSDHLQELIEERTRKLSESETRFRELVDMLPQTVFEIQENGKVEFVNREGLRSFGYTCEEIQKGLSVFQVLLPEDVERARWNLLGVMSGETPEDRKRTLETVWRTMSGENPDTVKRAIDRVGREFTVMRKNGSTFPVSVHALPIIRKGKPVGVRGIAVNITERKQMEEQLLEAKHLAAIGETAAMVGHDLRNPLQGATCAVYLAREFLKTQESEKTMEQLDMLDDAIRYMDKIVSDLQSYAAPVRIDPVETDLLELIAETLSSIKVPANIQANIVGQVNLSKVPIDPVLSRRILTNLIINGIQAMPQGGTLAVQCSKEDESITLTVKDTGVGIDPQIMDKIYTPFFTTKAQGQGLGLAVCKRLVEAQDGTITVKSEVGKYSNFTVRIPIIEDKA
jgi:PAS domain S-box-containing protein